MIELNMLKNTHRPKKRRKRVGRGVGSKRGKTSCKGEKGSKSRSGYRMRAGNNEGGQLPLFKKLPRRGFSRGRFKKEGYAINFERIDALFEDGDTVNLETLKEKGLIPKRILKGLKILAKGDLTKKVFIEANDLSKEARKKLESSGIEYKIIPLIS